MLSATCAQTVVHDQRRVRPAVGARLPRLCLRYPCARLSINVIGPTGSARRLGWLWSVRAASCRLRLCRHRRRHHRQRHSLTLQPSTPVVSGRARDGNAAEEKCA